jgi:hypothetical protein
MPARWRTLAPLLIAAVLAGCFGGGSGGSAAHSGGAGGSSGSSASSAGGPPVGSAAWVTAENAKPGLADWLIHGSAGKAAGLEAYADRVSVLPGERVGLAVNGRGAVRVRALRMGWYGGTQARVVWSGQFTAAPQPPAHQLVAPIADAGGIRGTRAAVAGWRTSLLVDTTGWPEGEYLFRLDGATASRYVPLTVRSASAAGRILVVAATMTWQAYNLWGGRDLYGDEDKDLANRSYAVSYDRPYGSFAGAGHFLNHDVGLVEQAEQAAVPLAYATDVDLARAPGLLAGASAVAFGGHAEYWTGPEHDAVLGAVARGTNLAVFGANTSYWRVRLAGAGGAGDARPTDRQDGVPRLVVGAKDAGLDPLAGKDPAGAMTKFRNEPAPRPEEALTGLRYDCHPAEAAWTVTDPAWWGYAGTRVRAGQQLAHVVGPESDRAYPVADRPHPMQVVAYTRFSCRDSPTAHTGVYWVAPSGAGAFTAATMRWTCAPDACSGISPADGAVVARVTRNILQAFAQPRAGRAHPATDTVAKYWLPAANTTGAA